MTGSAWHKGLELLLQGQEEEAQMVWLSAIAEGTPEEVEVWLAELVDILKDEAIKQEELENYDKAWLLRQHIRENDPENVNNLYALGNLYARLGEPEEAIAIHERVLEINPQFALSYVSIAHLLAPANRNFKLSQRDKVEQGIQALEKAIAIDPELPVLGELAYLQNILGEYAKGEQYARQAIAKNPQEGEVNSFTSRVLAESLLGQGKLDRDPTCTIDFSPLQNILTHQNPGKNLERNSHLVSTCIDLGGSHHLDESKPIVFLSSDRVYFRNFGIAQALSLYETSPRCGIHFHIMDPDLETFQLLSSLQGKLPDLQISHSYEFLDIADNNNPDGLIAKLVYYCCVRFCRAAEFIRNVGNTVIITDADVLFRRDLDSIVNSESDYDIALVDFGSGLPIYDRYCASLVIVRQTEAAKNYLNCLSDFIIHNLRQRSAWMLDQFGLYGVGNTYVKRNPDFKTRFLPDYYTSTEWSDRNPIWSAQNNKKWEQNRYTELKQKILSNYGFADLAADLQMRSVTVTDTNESMNECQNSNEILLSGFNQLCQAKYGLMLYNKNDLYIGRSLSYLGTWCEHEIDLLKQLISSGDVVLDVGANIGTHTLAFCQFVGARGKVYAFEAQRIIYQALVASIALNSISHAYCFNQAVGSEPGFINVPQIDFTRSDNFGGVVLQGTSRLEKTVASQYERVEMVTIDSLGLQQCHLIKADVEGMERDVIMGARNTIEKYHPILYLESHDDDTRNPLIWLCKQLGYILYWHGTENDPNILGIHPHQNIQIQGLVEVS
ncbi:FkbM family methyltransferase [Pseudanabaena sp. PCC 6802]|uniref:FkbM family methyltransferase n=1 Tax=Pseudanabaena sp. PCC 6802 TaxID=118173 RepID=UPI0003455910|nr:FkbM family methyltransferase [Pseudanabaena sp. PCC 6802]